MTFILPFDFDFVYSWEKDYSKDDDDGTLTNSSN